MCYSRSVGRHVAGASAFGEGLWPTKRQAVGTSPLPWQAGHSVSVGFDILSAPEQNSNSHRQFLSATIMVPLLIPRLTGVPLEGYPPNICARRAASSSASSSPKKYLIRAPENFALFKTLIWSPIVLAPCIANAIVRRQTVSWPSDSYDSQVVAWILFVYELLHSRCIAPQQSETRSKF